MMLRYPGGKKKASPLLHDLAPLYYAEYREPFVGSAGMLWRVPASKAIWINDVFPAVINYWRSFRDDDGFLEKMLTLAQEDEIMSEQERRDRFEAFKPAFVKNDDPLAYWYLNRHSQCAIVTKSRSGIATFTPNKGRLVKMTRTALEGKREFWRSRSIRMTVGDYAPLLFAPGKDVWLFMDPPYPLSNPAFYDQIWDWHDQERLASLVKSCPHRWMMTNADNTRIRRLYSEYTIRVRAYTGAVPNKAKNRQRRELIITNY